MHQLIKFAVVGSLAAFIHLGVLYLAVDTLGYTPMTGNTLAFIIAFIVSYAGQSLWTFNHKQHTHKGSMLRFLVTQLLCSFVLNQGLYALLLKLTHLDYMVASFIVLLTVPLATFTLSKYWAFK